MLHKKLKPLALVAAIALGSALVLPLAAHADGTQDEIKALKAQLEMLNKKLDDLSNKQEKTESTANTAQKQASEAKSTTVQMLDRVKFSDGFKNGTVNMHIDESNPNAVDSSNFLQRQRDDSLTFGMPGKGGIVLYGQLQASTDYANNGLDSIGTNAINPSHVPYGHNGYLAAIATDSTYVGLRGYQPIKGWTDAQFLWQLQTNIAMTSTAGTALNNSSQSNTVSGAMTTGTSYIGFGGKSWGSIKIGKTDAPYASSTKYFDPFAGMLGSMDVVMGNTGGDNRVEFGTLLEHAIWYESPKWNNLSFAALFAPGQNRASDSSSIPQGASNCAGGNVPGSGNPNAGTTLASQGFSCDDGGFSNAFSTSLVYDDKKLYTLVGYELHQNVNRGSDLVGYNGTPPAAASAIGMGSFDPISGNFYPGGLYSKDVGNEWAAKVGALYYFESTGTRFGGYYEWMRRDIPAVLDFQNERSRNGYWLVLMQDLPGANQLNLGFAHAGNPVGDAGGQHNFNQSLTDSSADMYTIALVHQVDRNLSFWGNFADTINHGNAHYDLGAGGHGIKTDCHDTGGPISASGGITGNPQCWGGNHVQGFSAGMKYRF